MDSPMNDIKNEIGPKKEEECKGGWTANEVMIMMEAANKMLWREQATTFADLETLMKEGKTKEEIESILWECAKQRPVKTMASPLDASKNPSTTTTSTTTTTCQVPTLISATSETTPPAWLLQAAAAAKKDNCNRRRPDPPSSIQQQPQESSRAEETRDSASGRSPSSQMLPPTPNQTRNKKKRKRIEENYNSNNQAQQEPPKQLSSQEHKECEPNPDMDRDVITLMSSKKISTHKRSRRCSSEPAVAFQNSDNDAVFVHVDHESMHQDSEGGHGGSQYCGTNGVEQEEDASCAHRDSFWTEEEWGRAVTVEGQANTKATAMGKDAGDMYEQVEVFFRKHGLMQAIETMRLIRNPSSSTSTPFSWQGVVVLDSVEAKNEALGLESSSSSATAVVKVTDPAAAAPKRDRTVAVRGMPPQGTALELRDELERLGLRVEDCQLGPWDGAWGRVVFASLACKRKALGTTIQVLGVAVELRPAVGDKFLWVQDDEQNDHYEEEEETQQEHAADIGTPSDEPSPFTDLYDDLPQSPVCHFEEQQANPPSIVTPDTPVRTLCWNNIAPITAGWVDQETNATLISGQSDDDHESTGKGSPTSVLCPFPSDNNAIAGKSPYGEENDNTESQQAPPCESNAFSHAECTVFMMTLPSEISKHGLEELLKAHSLTGILSLQLFLAKNGSGKFGKVTFTTPETVHRALSTTFKVRGKKVSFQRYREKKQESNTIVICDLHENILRECIFHALRRCGRVASWGIRLCKRPDTRSCTAYVTFTEVKGASTAVEFSTRICERLQPAGKFSVAIGFDFQLH